MLEESGTNKIKIIEGTQKGMQNKQNRIQNRSYLTTIFIAANWDQNNNGHENCPGDTGKVSIFSGFDNLIKQ